MKRSVVIAADGVAVEPIGSLQRAPVAIRAVPVRHYGRWLAAGVLLVLLALVVRVFAAADIDYAVTGHFLTAPNVLRGMANTVVISVLAQTIGIALGVLFAVMGMSHNPVMRVASAAYVWLFRGTPVLVQLLLWYNLSLVIATVTIPGVGSWPTNQLITPFVAALLGLGINEGAYMAEIVRAGIGSVDHGQTEAAHALGMSQSTTMRRIVLPQAMRVIIPPTGNETISMLKTTSLVSVLAYTELLYAAQLIYSRTYETIPLLVVASLWYVVVTSVLTVGQYYLERHFGRGSTHELPATPLQRLRRALLGRRA